MNSKLLPYALDVVSFLLEKTSHSQQVRQIILFGSAARGDAISESDVDIFIDLVQDDKKLAHDFEQILQRFYRSLKYLNYWKLKGIEHEVKLIAGTLSSWEDLLPSIVANGVVLYGKFIAEVAGKHQELFVWENITPNKKRVALNKKLFGYQYGKKFYLGLLQQQGGTRLGKGCIIVDLAAAQPLEELFKKHKVSVRRKKFISY